MAESNNEFRVRSEGAEFTVRLSRSKRWRRFRTDRRMYRIKLSQTVEDGVRDPLFLRLNNLLITLVHEVLRRIREEHVAAGRSRQSVAALSILARGLDRPIMTSLGNLMSDDIALDLLEQVGLVLTSKQEIALDQEFELHCQIIDGPNPDPNLLYVAGSVRKTRYPVPAQWKASAFSSKRFVYVMPVLDEKSGLQDCCLLLALVFSKIRRDFFAEKDTQTWQIVKRMGENMTKRNRRACELLVRETWKVVRECNIRIDVFRKAVLNDALRGEIDKLHTRVCIFIDEGGFRPIFFHPTFSDGTLPEDVVIALAPEFAEEDETGGDWEVLGTHAAVAKNRSVISCEKEKTRGTCEFCHRSLARQSLYRHKCAAANLPRCSTCMRVVHQAHMYIDKEVEKHRCVRSSAVFKTCFACQKLFFSDACQKWHKVLCNSQSRYCEKCERMYRVSPGRNHVCGDRYCRTCKMVVNGASENLGEAQSDHVCRMVPPTPQKTAQPLAFYDTESMCDETTGGVHEVNAVGLTFENRDAPGEFSEIYFYDSDMAHAEDGVLRQNTFFYPYWHSDNAKSAISCRKKKPNFKKTKRPQCSTKAAPKKAIDKFLNFILTLDFYDYVFVAHAGSRFDSILLLKELTKRMLQLTPLFDGNKALLIKIPMYRQRFIDSYRYTPMALAKFPDRFPALRNQPGVQQKGTFPFTFNKKVNYEYNAALPPRSAFIDEFSTDKAVRAYEKMVSLWTPSEPWNFKKEMHRYLVQDVRVLRGGMLCFLQEFYEFQNDLQKNSEGESHIFFHALSQPFFTRSSFVHALWQYFSMPRNQIFLISNQRNARQTSKHELEWLSFLSSTRGYIRTAASHAQGQARIGPFYPDGLAGDTVYEFNGCLVHYHAAIYADCPISKAFSPGDKSPFGKTFSACAAHWNRKKDYYESRGFRVVVKWECEYVRDRQEVPAVIQFVKTYYENSRPENRLCLRHSLRGGRTETFRLLYDATLQPEKKMYYVDKNSLYPAVAIFHRFPVGLPSVYIGESIKKIGIDSQLQHFFDSETGRALLGVIQATVMAPESVFVPVLPVRDGNKLKFGLCRTCIRHMIRERCRHVKKDRQITDTWTTPEVLFALQCGYRLITIWEMYVYEQSDYIFKDFYTRLARIKLESEGYSPAVEAAGSEAKERYVADLNDKMPGLNLSSSNVKKNAGRRAFAKDVSNSGLGKFSQNDLKGTSQYVSSYQELQKLLYQSPNVQVKSVTPLTETLAEVCTVPRDDAVGYHRNTQVVIYALVTAYARIGMMKDMRSLMRHGADLYYMDTDSLFFTLSRHQDVSVIEKEFSMGSKAYNAYKYETEQEITSFVSLGAKNYCFVTETGESVVKVRGFTLTNNKARSILNYASMKEMLDHLVNENRKILTTSHFCMRIDRKTLTIKNSTLEKKYRSDCYDKRIIDSLDLRSVTTVPFGACHLQYDDRRKESI